MLLRARAAHEPSIELAGDVAANATTLEALGCRTESLRATLLAAELWVGLGDIATADLLCGADRSATLRDSPLFQ